MAEKILKIEYDENAVVDITVKPAQQLKLSLDEFEAQHKDLVSIITAAADGMREPTLSAVYQGYLLGQAETALYVLCEEAKKAGVSADDVKMMYDIAAQSPVFDQIDIEKMALMFE